MFEPQPFIRGSNSQAAKLQVSSLFGLEQARARRSEAQNLRATRGPCDASGWARRGLTSRVPVLGGGQGVDSAQGWPEIEQRSWETNSCQMGLLFFREAISRLLFAPLLKVNGQPISWPKVIVLTSKQKAPKIFLWKGNQRERNNLFGGSPRKRTHIHLWIHGIRIRRF